MNNLDENFKLLFNDYINKGHLLFDKNKKLYMVSIIHFLIWCFFLLMPFIIIIFNLKTKLNYFYLAMNLILVYQWILFKGDCCISYAIKKKINHNYKKGDYFYLSVEGYYDIFKKKWFRFNNTFQSHYNKLSKLILLNIITFVIVLFNTKLSLNQKCSILSIFIILKIIYLKIIIKNIRRIQKIMIDQKTHKN